MEIHYYVVRENSELYAKILELDTVVKDCWNKADQIATKHQAISFLNGQDAYAGGISAFYFAEDRPLNSKVWEKVEMDVHGEKETVYVPKVNIRKEWMDAEEASKLPESLDRLIVRTPGNPKVQVLTLSGCSKAIKIYREMISLPIVPEGTLERLIGIEKPAYRYGYSVKLPHLYIVSYESISHPDLTPCDRDSVESLQETGREEESKA